MMFQRKCKYTFAITYSRGECRAATWQGLTRAQVAKQIARNFTEVDARYLDVPDSVTITREK